MFKREKLKFCGGDKNFHGFLSRERELNDKKNKWGLM